MRIALVVPSIPKYSETFLTNKIAGLKASGFDVVLMVVGVSEKRNIGVPVHYQPILAASGIKRWMYTLWLIFKSLLKAPKRVFKLLSETKKIGYSLWGQWRLIAVMSNFLPLKNIDWVHFAYGTMAVERAFIGHVLGAKVAMSLRGYDISIAPIMRPHMYAQVWPFLDKLHSISFDLLTEAKKHGMPESLPSEIIHPAIDTANVKNEKREFTNSTLRILTVGRLHWKKGLEYTLEALAKLDVDFTFTVIGEGEERERLLFAAHQLGISSKVNFAGKKVHADVLAAMKNNDIYLQYSIQEGFCNAVLEAQAAGMLCIVSNAEGLSENVMHEKTGWVVEKRNPKLLAQRIKQVALLSALEKHTIGKNAIQRVKNNFSLEKQNQQFASFYDKS